MTERILILGAGGHAQVVADILLRMWDAGLPIAPIGYLDDNPALVGKALLGLPVLGTLAGLGRVAHDAVIVAIGANHARRSVFERLELRGDRFAIARHPSAIVAPDVLIGPGTVICAGVIINPGTVIGANVILNTASSADHHNRVGDHAHIAPGVHMGGDVVVGAGALVGIGATVMPQRTIGAWSVVGAGGVVTADIPGDVVAVGVPARVVKSALC